MDRLVRDDPVDIARQVGPPFEIIRVGFQENVLIRLPFLKSVIDFDIVIEIGYAEEMEQPLTLKQLFLLDISSRSTVRDSSLRVITSEFLQ